MSIYIKLEHKYTPDIVSTFAPILNESRGPIPRTDEPTPVGTMSASASQPRRNGPVLLKALPVGADAKALKWRLFNTLLNASKPMTAKALAARFRAGEESVKASLRDLRKRGINVECFIGDKAYVYRVAA